MFSKVAKLKNACLCSTVCYLKKCSIFCQSTMFHPAISAGISWLDGVLQSASLSVSAAWMLST